MIKTMQEIVGIDRATDAPVQLYCYSSDASQIRGTPDCVVRPQDTEQVSRIMRFAMCDMRLGFTAVYRRLSPISVFIRENP